MPDRIVVDIYCRVATSSPEDTTHLNEQEQACREYCQAHNLTVGAVFHDVFSGNQYRERSGLKSIRLRYREGRIEGVVITTFDRLSRSQFHLIIMLEEMKRYNVTLYIVKEKMEDTVVGRLVATVLTFIAELEREKGLDNELNGNKISLTLLNSRSLPSMVV